MSKRRILEKIKIDEISAVDKPAMEDARVTIMKRAQEPNVSKLDTLEDSILVLKDRVDSLNKNLTARAERVRPSQDFDDVVAAIRKRDNCSGTAATSEARRRHPDLFKAFQKA